MRLVVPSHTQGDLYAPRCPSLHTLRYITLYASLYTLRYITRYTSLVASPGVYTGYASLVASLGVYIYRYMSP